MLNAHTVKIFEPRHSIEFKRHLLLLNHIAWAVKLIYKTYFLGE